jgi:hypothetical protein
MTHRAGLYIMIPYQCVCVCVCARAHACVKERDIIIIIIIIEVYLSDRFVDGKSVYFFKTSVTNNGKLFIYVLIFLKNYSILNLLQ